MKHLKFTPKIIFNKCHLSVKGKYDSIQSYLIKRHNLKKHYKKKKYKRINIVS